MNEVSQEAILFSMAQDRNYIEMYSLNDLISKKTIKNHLQLHSQIIPPIKSSYPLHSFTYSPVIGQLFWSTDHMSSVISHRNLFSSSPVEETVIG